MKLSIKVLNRHVGLRKGCNKVSFLTCGAERHRFLSNIISIFLFSFRSMRVTVKLCEIYLLIPFLCLSLDAQLRGFSRTILRRLSGGCQTHPLGVPEWRWKGNWLEVCSIESKGQFRTYWKSTYFIFLNLKGKCLLNFLTYFSVLKSIVFFIFKYLFHIPFLDQIPLFYLCEDSSVLNRRTHSSMTTNDLTTPSRYLRLNCVLSFSSSSVVVAYLYVKWMLNVFFSADLLRVCAKDARDVFWC